MATKNGVPARSTQRVTVTLDAKDAESLRHWADKTGVSINEYMKAAILFKMQWDSKDYPLPPMEIQRLNQLIDIITVLSSNIRSLEQVTVSGFDSLLGLTRGDNYLLEQEDGEIG